MDKIVKIRCEINQNNEFLENLDNLREEVQQFENPQYLDNMKLATEEEIKTIIASMSNASCDLDHLPTEIIKSCTDELLPAVTAIVNSSVENADFPF